MSSSSGVAARIIHSSQKANAVIDAALSENRRWARSPRFLNQTRKYIAANVRQADAIIDHTTVTQLSDHRRASHPARAGIRTIRSRAPMRATRGPVITVGRRHAAPELVVSIWSAFELNRL